MNPTLAKFMLKQTPTAITKDSEQKPDIRTTRLPLNTDDDADVGSVGDDTDGGKGGSEARSSRGAGLGGLRIVEKLKKGKEAPLLGGGKGAGGVPAVGLVVGFGGESGKERDVQRAILQAVELGYRRLDIEDERVEGEVGAALADILKEGSVKREEIWVAITIPSLQASQESSKGEENANPRRTLEQDEREMKEREERMSRVAEKSLQRLGLEYADLVTLSAPAGGSLEAEDDSDAQPDHVLTWKALESLYHRDRTRIRAIGLRSYTCPLLDQLLQHASIYPAVNVIQSSVWQPQTELVEYCQTRGVHVSAEKPFGPEDKDVEREKGVGEIGNLAKKYGLTTRGVLLSYHLARNVSAVVDSLDHGMIEEGSQLARIDAANMDVLNNIAREMEGRR